MSNGRLARTEVTSLPQGVGRLSRFELTAGFTATGQLSRVVIVSEVGGVATGQLGRVQLFAGNVLQAGRLSRVEVAIANNPTVTAGSDVTDIEPWAVITLTGVEGGDTATSRQWRQISGAAVVLATPTAITTTYEAPGAISGALLKFGFTASNASGASTEAVVTHTVMPVTERAVVGGVEVPLRLLAVSL